MLTIKPESQLRLKAAEVVKKIEKKGFVLDAALLLVIIQTILAAIMAAYQCRQEPIKRIFLKAKLRRMIGDKIPEIPTNIIMGAMKAVGDPLSFEEIECLHTEARIVNVTKLCDSIMEDKK